MAIIALSTLASGVTYTAAAGFAFSMTMGTFLTNLALGAALRALTPKPSFSGANRGYQVNSSGSALDHQVIYGKVRVGGAIVYDEATGSTNEYLHRIIAVSGHEVQSFDRIYINDEYIDVSDLGSDGNVPLVYSSDGSTTSDRYDGKLRIQLALGTSGQVANADLVTESDGLWTSDHRLRGIAYMYARMKFDANVYPNGIPVFTADVKGKKVYNPATTNTAWSDNPALCVRDYLTTTGYGLGELSVNIDDTLVSAAATVCNQTNTVAGTTRYTCNGAFTTSSTPYDTINSLLTSMDATLWYSQGKWRMKPAYWTTPVLDLNEDDLRSSISVSTRHSRRSNFNTVKGTFRGLESNWQTTDYPEVTNAAFVSADNGQESVADVDLPFTDNSIEARRIALISLERNRQQLTVSASFGIKTLQLQVGDNIRLTNSRFGWDNKEFEVVSWNFGLTDGLDLQSQMTLRETASSVYDEVSDGKAYERDNTNLPDPFVGLAISNLAVSGGGRLQGDGTFINSAILSWTAAPNSFVTSYEVQWKALADSSYSSTTTTNLTIEITPLVDNVEYNFRVRSVSSNGVNGPFSTINFTGGGDTTAPALPTSVSADGAFRYITVGWTNPADIDLKHVEVYENTSNTTVGANLVGISGGSEFVRANLNLNQTLYYFLKSVDYSNNKSGFTTGVSATTTFVDDDDFENGVYTLFTDQGLYAIKDVSSLPASGAFTGEKVFNTSDAKIYNWTGSAWEATASDVGTLDFSDLTGTLANAQIAVNAISGTKITDNTITSTEIAANTISAGNIAANAIGTSELSALAVTADKIAANAITAAKISAGVITGDKISANTITGGLIAASGIITNSAQINDAVIVNAKIANLAVGTIKVADRAITSQTAVFVSSASTSSTNLLAASLSISADAGEEILFGTTFEVKGSGTDKTGSARAYLNGSLLVTGSGTDSFNSFTAIRSITATQGTNTLQIYLDSSSPGIAYLSNASLFALEAFK